MAGKRRKLKRNSTISQQSQQVRLIHYEITDEPIMDEAYKRLPADVKDRLEHLCDLAQHQPNTAIPELLALRKSYPHIPQIGNYLAMAYSRSGQNDKKKQLIQENYQRNPKYLFARIHYAESCYRDGDYAKIAEIFDHKFDLQLLYPHRKRFHSSEVLGFFGICGRYFVAIGERELAEKVYQLLIQIDPKHPYTRALKRQLYPGLFHRLLMRFFKRRNS